MTIATSPIWDLVKDGLGFASAIIMAIRWVRDFAARVRRDWLRRLPARGALRRAIDRFADRLDSQIDRAKGDDIAYMAVGLVLLAFSFGISLYRSVFPGS